MNTRESVIAAAFKRVRLSLTGTFHTIRLRSAGIVLRRSQAPLQLLKNTSAIRIARLRLHAGWRMKLKKDEKICLAPLKDILENQSLFMQQIITDQQQAIKERTLHLWNQRQRSKRQK